MLCNTVQFEPKQEWSEPFLRRKVFLLTSQVTETVYLWRGQVMRSFEELSTAVCADLEAKVCQAISQWIASTHSNSSNCMTYAL